MKFLNVHCFRRKTDVFINIERITLLSRTVVNDTEACLIEIAGLDDGKGPVEVHIPVEQVIRMINGDDKVKIGFRTNPGLGF
jgi:hypothetical protein